MTSNTLTVQVVISASIIVQITTAVVIGWTIIHAIRHHLVLREGGYTDGRLVAGRAIIWRSISLFLIVVATMIAAVIAVYNAGTACQSDVWRSVTILGASLATHFAGLAEVYERVSLSRIYQRDG